MKRIAFILSFFMFAGIGVLRAQADSTVSFKVFGNCESCKSRIEKSAKAAGAVSANWNDETGMMTVVFNGKKTSTDKIQQKIAAAGHDTEKYKALQNAYDNLPGCCKYDRSIEKEKVQGDH